VRFEALPRRIFFDSCAAQTLRDYDAYIYDGESIPESTSQAAVVFRTVS